MYYILGTSIAEGKGYRLLNEPGEIQAIQYPPMLPLVVAVHQWVLGSSDPLVVGPWLRLSSFAIFFGYTVTTCAVLRYYLPLKVALVGVMICLLHLHMYFMSDLLYPKFFMDSLQPHSFCSVTTATREPLPLRLHSSRWQRLGCGRLELRC